MTLSKEKRVMLGVLAVSAILIGIGAITGDPGVIGNMFIISMFIVIVPIFLFKYTEYMWLRAVENEFPSFVRDLADAKRSGMSLPESVKVVSKSDYGKLTTEIHKMNNRLTWGTPFLRVLEIFGYGVKRSRMIREALDIIRESYETGGDVAATLNSVARNMLMLKEAEAERESLVKQHVFIMYGVFFMFLSISVMIIQVMVPMVQAQPIQTEQSGALGLNFENPCKGIGGFPCDLFKGAGLMLGIPEGIGQYYTSLFFYVVIIQGIFTGLIAGQIGENSTVAGSKHSLIMTFIAIGVFLFMAKTGTLPF
ncbi:MAG: type II secretion system F family protein [Candidatus Aenigmatarchaeota archaeon]